MAIFTIDISILQNSETNMKKQYSFSKILVNAKFNSKKLFSSFNQNDFVDF